MRNLLTGLGLQIFLAVLLLKFLGSQHVFLFLNKSVEGLADSTKAGTALVFGYLGGPGLPFDEKSPGASYILVFQGLPLVLVIVNLKGGKGHVYV